ncbi:glutathione S-transferase [Salinisphaera hydrothermalis]|uniref:glutathione transferase n=1 Tax=Salinisphaera hydrothermalis (strain C41B8) TaxID=1304275 RepID=A0A084IRG3_SALHC|nr:glutathione S-transferase [Salinisphaera hydrothermalis]KEZ79297.1 glutathione S-transferase [Salinisphaera hydrothermalis C41B8]
MITVHHLADSRSQRVLWLLEELEIPYEVERYARDPKTMLAPEALKRVHPLGKSPVITDAHRTVAETGLIVDYIVREHGGGRLAPAPGSEEYLRYQYWLHYAEGSLMPPLLLQFVFDTVETKAPWLARPMARAISGQVKKQWIRPQRLLHFDYLENELRSHEWFVGDTFSAADIMLSFPIEAAVSRGGAGERCPKLREFVARIHARPAYRRALERGGPYAYA